MVDKEAGYVERLSVVAESQGDNPIAIMKQTLMNGNEEVQSKNLSQSAHIEEEHHTTTFHEGEIETKAPHEVQLRV